jgi:type I restriction enzyme S subunit
MSTKWAKVKLADILKPIWRQEKVIPSSEYRLLGTRWYGGGLFIKEVCLGQQIRADRLYRVQKGNFVYNRLFAWKGSFALAGPESDGCYVSNEFPCFEVDQNYLDSNFLLWYFRREITWNEVLNLSTGATPTSRNRLKEQIFLNLEIPLPPLAEQRRIVAKIDQLAAKIAEARGLCDQTIAETEFLTRSVFNSAFQSRTDWKCAEVGDLCEPPQYGFTESAITDPIGPHFLRITDIQGGSVNWDSVPYCDCPDPTKYLLQPDDILFARTGATTGKSFLIAECPTAVFASYLIRLRVRKQVTPEYLYIFFQSPQYWNQIADQKKGTGQPNLNGSKLSHLRIPVPPLHEQSHIVSRLKILQAKVNVLRGLQAQTTAELDALLPSILDKAFKGEL